MLNRLTDSFCHPSRLGLYHKDKWYIVFLYLFSMIILMASCAYISGINEKYFTKDDCNLVYSLILNSDDEFDLRFEDNVLMGSEASITSEVFDASFLGSNEAPRTTSSKMTMNFNSDNVAIYLGDELLNVLEYKNLNVESFSFNDLIHKDIASKLAFFDLLMHSFMSVNTQYVNIDITSGVLSYILTYAFLLIIVVAFSYMSNPDLTFDIRVKISIYGSLIYFLLIFFKICLGIKLFEYLAFILPVFYVNTALRRIVRVRIKRG